MKFINRWNQYDIRSNVLEFTSQYQEFYYDLGETINTDDVKSVTVKVSDQQGNIAIKLYAIDEDGEKVEKAPNYLNNFGKSEYSYTPEYEGNVRYIGIMSMKEGGYPYSVTIDDIVVSKTNKKVLTYEGDKLVFTEGFDGLAVDGSTLEFDKEWREYRLSLGQAIYGEDIKSVKFTF